MAASASFATPIGYQTNLIVQSIGGYKFKDFLKVGIPLGIICLTITTIFVPLIYWGSLTDIQPDVINNTIESAATIANDSINNAITITHN